MLKFKTVSYKNFLSTGNVPTIIDLDNGKRNLVLGENGAGKSTVIDAICFSLFGKSFRGNNKPQLINSINNRDCVTEIVFETKGNNYRVVRGIKPAIFEVYSNNVLISQTANAKDYQDYLEKNILGFNFRSFTQIDVLGTSNYTPFMRMPLAARRDIIEDLLDLTIFSKMNVLLKEQHGQNKENLADLDRVLTIENEKLKLYRDHSKQNKENILKRLSIIKDEIENVRDELTIVQVEINNININIQTKNASIVDTENIKQRQRKFHQLDYAINSNISSLQKKIDLFRNNDTCPTCTQLIDSDFKTVTVNDLTEKSQEFGTKHLQLKEKINKLDEIIINHTNIAKQIQESGKLLAEKTTLHDGKFSHLKRLMFDYEKLSKEIVEFDMNDQIDAVQKIIEQLGSQKEYHISQREIMHYTGMLLKDGGIKSKIIEQYVPIINTTINNYLQSMDFYINFELDENFNEKITALNKDEFTYWSFSEGERQRIDLALLFAFRQIAKLKNSLNTNLLFLDEIFDSSLDNNGTEELLRILDSQPNTSIFVISHKSDHLVDKFENVIRFKKSNNFSVRDTDV